MILTPNITPWYNCRKGEKMSQWDKLINEVLKLNRSLRFEDLAKA